MKKFLWFPARPQILGSVEFFIKIWFQVIHFNNPKVQASGLFKQSIIFDQLFNRSISVPANTFSITGNAENKRLCLLEIGFLRMRYFLSEITEMLPGILNQLGAESLTHLKKLANNVTSQFKVNEEEDVPGWIWCVIIIQVFNLRAFWWLRGSLKKWDKREHWCSCYWRG